jgi:predicted SAM-dependent methyltransferase
LARSEPAASNFALAHVSRKHQDSQVDTAQRQHRSKEASEFQYQGWKMAHSAKQNQPRVSRDTDYRDMIFGRLKAALRYKKAITPFGKAPYGADVFESIYKSGIEFGELVTDHPEGISADIANLKNDNFSSDLNQMYKLGEVGYFLRLNIEDQLPINDACVDWVFSEHTIEHISLNNAIKWLTEIRRILRPGGLLRIITPDLSKYIDGYRDSDFFEIHRKNIESFGLPKMPNRHAFMVNQIFYNWEHKWIYDFSEITFVLTQAGFDIDCIRQCQFQIGKRDDVAKLDRFWRKDESLYVEVTK